MRMVSVYDAIGTQAWLTIAHTQRGEDETSGYVRNRLCTCIYDRLFRRYHHVRRVRSLLLGRLTNMLRILCECACGASVWSQDYDDGKQEYTLKEGQSADCPLCHTTNARALMLIYLKENNLI